MTQGAIDLVQAELSPPALPSTLLLEYKPHTVLKLIATGPKSSQAPEHTVISKYTWWDEGDFVCISLPTAILSASASHHVQCNVRAWQVHCSFHVASVGGQLVQHTLTLPRLYAAVQPQHSSCRYNGEQVQLSDVATAQISATAQDGSNNHALTSSCTVRDACIADLGLPAHHPCSSANSSVQARQHAKQGSQQSLQAGTAVADFPGAALLPHQSKHSSLLISLCKADPSKTWTRLTGEPVVNQPAKHVQPDSASMAALRRALIQQRVQRQRAGDSRSSSTRVLPTAAIPPEPLQCGSLLETRNMQAESLCRHSEPHALNHDGPTYAAYGGALVQAFDGHIAEAVPPPQHSPQLQVCSQVLYHESPNS